MNSNTVTILLTCFCIIHNVVVTVAYLTSAPPTTISSTDYAKQQINQININYAESTTTTDNIELLQKKHSVLQHNHNIIDYNGDKTTTNNIELLQMKQSLLGRAYRRGKKLLTREKEDTTTKNKEKEEPEQLWRVMFHNSEYMPDRVARELTKVFPITRMTAFDICVRARSEGIVTVDICHKKQAEKYVRQLSKRGLVATIQPE